MEASTRGTVIRRMAFMKKDLTELVFILDRSGSMMGMVDDTIGGFNAMLERQKEKPGDAYVSTVLFSNSSKVIHDRVKIKQVQPLTRQQYFVGGCTALLDAIGGAIHHIGNIHKYAREEDVPEHTLFIIITDGMENASHQYSIEMVRQKIQKEKEKYGWEFLFLGANLDAVETAGGLGINKNRAVTYTSDSEGTRLNYEAVDEAVTQMRCMSAISDDWKSRIEQRENEKR